MTWTRKHDAVIAEKILRINVVEKEDDYWCQPQGGTGSAAWSQIPRFNKQYEEVMRAAFVWRWRRDGRFWSMGQDNEGSEWAEIGTHGGKRSGRLVKANALAWLLWMEVKNE